MYLDRKRKGRSSQVAMARGYAAEEEVGEE
jgi:hypothetical protein